MKKIMILILFGIIFNITQISAAENDKPDYEKYGRIAITVVKEDFPGEEVVEYQFKGREKISETDVVDSFQFQVKENDKPVTIIVKISHSLKNKKLLSLTVEEKIE